MGNFKKLAVWEKAHQLALHIYKSTQGFPKDELYSLTSQIRRAAVSVPANVVEGSARSGDTEFVRFLTIARGSANELEYHLLLARDLGYLESAVHQQLECEVIEVQRMLNGLIQTIQKSPRQ